jgi:hypothetical protein
LPYTSPHLSRITFETYHGFDQVRLTWQSLLPEHHHLVSCDIEALELSKPGDTEFRYINILENGELIGIMYLQFLVFNKHHYDTSILDKPPLKYIKGIIARQSAHIMVCGNLFRVHFQGFYFKDKDRKELIFNCLLQYRRTMDNGKRFSGILVKDCSREFSEIEFGCHSFRSFTQDLTMELAISDNWKTFADYTNSLTRKYRQRAAKIQAAGQEIRKVDLSLEELVTYKTDINCLYMHIVQKQSLALGILNADYFVRMKSVLNDHFKVFAYFEGDRMVAFSSHIYYPLKESMEIHYIGLDYEANQKYQLYFNILFDGIKTAIDQQFKKIEMGRTAREAKANAGAHAVENYNYIWLKPGIPRLAVSFLGKRFEDGIGNDWQKRNPFKEVQSNPEARE